MHRCHHESWLQELAFREEGYTYHRYGLYNSYSSVCLFVCLFVCLIVIMDVLAPRTHTFLGPMALYLSISYNAAGSSQINGSKRD